MKAIKQAQSLDINDNCTTCGSMLDIGAVINETDTLLEMNFELSYQGLKSAKETAEQARKKFENIKVIIEEQDNQTILKLEFDVAVEKMLFQMQNLGL